MSASETGSMAKAATICHLTTSSVSKHIKDLEQELGVPLLVRKKNDVKLTEYGESFIVRARNIIREEHEAKEEIKAISGELCGDLYIGAGCFIEPFIGLPIAHFMIKYPKVHVHMSYNYAHELNRMLRSQELDLAFSMNWAYCNEGIVSTPCFSFGLSAIMHKDHPLASKDMVTENDLVKYRIILPDNGKRELSTFQQMSGLDISRIISSSTCECNNANSLLNGLQILDAITFLPAEYVMNRQNLIAKPIEGMEKTFVSKVHWIKDVPLKASAKAFLAMIEGLKI